jgi:hypothetical protein
MATVYHRNIKIIDGKEVWSFTSDKVFQARKEAVEYAIQKNKEESGAIKLWNGSAQRLEDFMHVFTTDPIKYITFRDYFVGDVPYDKLREVLGDDVEIVYNKLNNQNNLN